jgi:hypothetical protein
MRITQKNTECVGGHIIKDFAVDILHLPRSHCGVAGRRSCQYALRNGKSRQPLE